jgi:predicted polyphosphate/ATP-dependent NAD kinase
LIKLDRNMTIKRRAENIGARRDEIVNSKNSIRSTVLVVNPNSCSGLTGKNWEDLYAKFKGIFGENIEFAFSKKPGDGTLLARKYLKEGYKSVVAIGGDGTINEVANGFFEKKADGRFSSGVPYYKSNHKDSFVELKKHSYI